MTIQEKRKYLRIKTTKHIKHTLFSLLGASLSSAPESTSRDLSAGGIMFESKNSYSVGDIIRLEAQIPGWEKYKPEFIKPGQLSRSEPVIALAKVVRVKIVSVGKYEISVQFVGIDDGHQMGLAKYIKQQLKSSK